MEAKMKKTLRLLITKTCHRTCDGCCNKDFDLDNLPIFDINDLNKYDQIILTGGEPMLRQTRLIDILEKIESCPSKILYTASTILEIISLLRFGRLNGLTLTLHDNSDAMHFYELQKWMYRHHKSVDIHNLSLRLNIFKNVHINYDLIAPYWKVKNNITWIKNCPLPPNETFMRWEDIS
jgi:organic radical activating enzyme